MNGIFIRWLTLTGAIIITSYLLDGIRVSGFVSAFFAAAMLGILNALFRPIIIILTLPINILTLGFFTFVINALLLQIRDVDEYGGFDEESLTVVDVPNLESHALRDGDVVEIQSASGSLRAPVVTYPAIRPDVVAMPIGQGHRNYGRYASGRGANPLAIVNNLVDRDSGALAWGATMVGISRTGDHVDLIRTSGTPRELGRSILSPYGEGGKPDPHADDEHHG